VAHRPHSAPRTPRPIYAGLHQQPPLTIAQQLRADNEIGHPDERGRVVATVKLGQGSLLQQIVRYLQNGEALGRAGGPQRSGPETHTAPHLNARSPISTVAGDVVAFPVPGHTRGSVLNLVDGHLLFSGDSLSWNPWDERLHAFRRACWYSWREQTAALGRSAYSGRRFDRLFCGHGWSHDFAAEAFHTHLVVELVALMPAM
jgi:glyoxylase-like metal-dependent hydrolase (beta-lactamase superfamily II)